MALQTLEALVTGLHRAAQLRLPITIAGAGLPSLATLTGEAKSYAERMFTFPVIGSLSVPQAREALVVPAEDEGVRWEEGALARVVEVTKGYPYFLQEFGKQAWDVADGPDVITADDVDRSIPVATAELDDGFFRVTDRSDQQSRARLPAGDGGAGSGSRTVSGRRRLAGEEDHRPRTDERRPAQEGALLLAALGGDRLHRADVRRVHEALDPGSTGPGRLGRFLAFLVIYRGAAITQEATTSGRGRAP